MTTKKHFGIYEIEPLGKLLIERLKLSKALVAIIFSFLYFGVLLILHSLYGHPRPANINELFSLPTSYYYYPNLLGISFDLIGNPLFFVFLAILRDFVPKQFAQLEQDNLIEEKHTHSIISSFTEFVAHNNRVQTFIVFIFPAIISFLLAVQSILVFQPQELPEQYAIFLSFLGNYAKIVIIIQLVYAFLVMNRYTYKPRLHLSHPDNCSGISPFGNLAILVYGFLFLLAVFQAIGISSGGSAWQKTLTEMGASYALIYVWLLFPIAIILVFTSLVYQPHIELKRLQTQHLKSSSAAWTEYHQNIQSSILEFVKKSQTHPKKKVQKDFGNELHILQTWSKLDEDVQAMHTWPISKSRFRILASFVNPIIPILLPIVIDFIKSLL